MLANHTAPTTAASPVEGAIFLRAPAAAKRLAISVPTLWRWCRTNPEFPRPAKLGAGVTVWRITDLDAFAAAQIAASTDATPPTPPAAAPVAARPPRKPRPTPTLAVPVEDTAALCKEFA